MYVNISKWFPTKVSGYHMNDYFRRKHPLGQGIYLNMVFAIWHKSRQAQLGKTIERETNRRGQV